jgi:hypothetical protein
VTTALVHEAWLKLVGLERISDRNRAHCFALAARAMRRIHWVSRRQPSTGSGQWRVPGSTVG